MRRSVFLCVNVGPPDSTTGPQRCRVTVPAVSHLTFQAWSSTAKTFCTCIDAVIYVHTNSTAPFCQLLLLDICRHNFDQRQSHQYHCSDNIHCCLNVASNDGTEQETQHQLAVRLDFERLEAIIVERGWLLFLYYLYWLSSTGSDCWRCAQRAQKRSACTEDSGLLAMRSATLVAALKTWADGCCRKYHFYSAIVYS